ncbi:response regulator [Flammeovirga yaeyamensis]|uniref:histidine kinase n=1 Tax=Flammeovirga yaeyamensis TaxID=367791 RepID=A0AAX1NA86_9BACT|nr:ATP-binding protein [Flammeovirga yaeyamensis]MBB3701366.1 signal transduction histidine kinase/ligand-binding sensor domain-containing protein/DNA-binding response OmpR family regulator [Flammeovirga yaeyamensis]NMF38566.1 response regulator [Flammeovirga yaeyamensis]QWG04470.1 response regulator [Flammeovirga yaeyamensis]
MNYYLLLLITFFTTITVYGQQDQFIKLNLSADGRPITDINKDQQGFLWVGTFGNGIYKYDGLNYELFNYSVTDSSKINDNFIRCSLIDNDQKLWIGTNKGISYFDTQKDKFIPIRLSNTEDVVAFEMEETKDESIILATNTKGIYIKNKDNSIDFYPMKLKLEDYFKINSLATRDHKNYYLATNQGLFIFNYLRKTFTKVKHKDLPENISIQKVYLSKNGTLWIGTVESGIYTYKISSEKVEAFPVTTTRIMDFCDSESGIFVATENDGVFVFDVEDNNKYLHFESNAKDWNSLSSNSVWSLYAVDKNKILIGYYEFGVGLYDPEFYKFSHLSHNPYNKNSLATSSVNSIVSDNNGLLWLGQDGGGMTRYDQKLDQYSTVNTQNNQLIKGLGSDAVQSVFKDSKGQTWVATWGNGIYYLPKGKTSFVNYTKDNSNLSSDRVIYFDEDSYGRIWIATFDRGICYFNAKDQKMYYPNYGDFVKTSLSTKDVRNVLVDGKDNVWVGTTEGLFYIETQDKQFKVKTVLSQQLGGDNILSLFISQDRHLWIGTDGAGLYKYNLETKQLISYYGNNKVNRKVICGITEDLNGNIWLSSKNGIAVIQKWNDSVRYFTQKDGLVSENFNYNSIAFDPNSNTLFAGSIRGLNYIDASIIKPQKCEAEIFFNTINIHQTKFQNDVEEIQRKITDGEEVVLSQDENIFSIDFTGIDFPYSDKIDFAYYLEGPEKSWNYVGAVRNVTYTSLPRGEYVFHLKGMDNNGVWTKEKTIKIKVLPYWYQSNLAIVVYVLLFLLGLYFLNRIMKARVRILEEAKGERERRLQEEELTKAKLRFFTNISHEFRTPLTLILNPITDMISGQFSTQQLREKNVSIYRNALRLKNLIDELMDFRKLNSKNMSLKAQLLNPEEVIEEAILFFEEEAESRNIEISIKKDFTNEIQIYLDESMIEKIIFNLFSNAFKLMDQNGEININLSLSDTYLRISVSDTGPGISKENLEKVFDRFYQVDAHQDAYYGGTGVGLEVVKQFVELHKGKISVESIVGVGTTFHLDFPMGKDHLDENQIFDRNSLNRKKYVLPVSDHKSVIATTSSASKKQSVLLVEDNYELRSYLKEALHEHYQIHEASDGVNALDLLEEKNIDIIISDVMMPNMDGFTLCEKVKTNLKISHIPLILLTAKNDQEDKIKGIDLGADAYIQKPFDLELLHVTIKQLLKSRQVIFDRFIGKYQEEGFESPTTTNVDQEFLKTITDYVYQHISDPNLNVEHLAGQLNLSRSQLYRKIKALTGLTATVFIKRIRLEQAKKLILVGNSNMSDVGYQTGFSSPSYFSKCYKEYFNILPTQELKEVEGKE